MSKKIILLAIVSAGLMFSCQKSTIQPNNTSGVQAEETPVWRGVSASGNESETRSNTIGIILDDIHVDGIDITDPNNDEDRNKKRKGNN